MSDQHAAAVAELLDWACKPQPDCQDAAAKSHVYTVIMKHLKTEPLHVS